MEAASSSNWSTRHTEGLRQRPPPPDHQQVFGLNESGRRGSSVGVLQAERVDERKDGGEGEQRPDQLAPRLARLLARCNLEPPRLVGVGGGGGRRGDFGGRGGGPGRRGGGLPPRPPAAHPLPPPAGRGRA